MDERASARLGNALMPLWADPREWMHRIVESVSFVDAATIRRSRSFDLTVPRGAPMLAGRTVLPLALLGRRVLSELDVSDDTGRRLPLLTAEQNGAVSAALLVAAAREGESATRSCWVPSGRCRHVKAEISKRQRRI